MATELDNDVAQPPAYLNDAFFEEAVENAEREAHVKIESVKFTLGSATGENYLSQIYRAKVQYRVDGAAESNAISLIIKSMPIADANRFISDLQVFLKEKIIYSDVIPRMEMYLDGDKRFAARLYYSIKDPINTFVFEDLKEKGFVMACREKGLDEAHARLVMRRLAKFHAISMIMGKKDPTLFTKLFKWGLISRRAMERDNSVLLQFFTGNLQGLIGTTKQWPGFEGITKKLEKFLSNIAENIHQSQIPLPGELKVLNHGDLWVNNMLFRYDQQRNVQDLIFVDFQMSVWRSPGIDLNYFFYTSLQLDLLKHKRDELLKEYHSTLCNILRSHDYTEVPSYEQIRQEVRNRETFGFLANYAIFPMLAQDKQSSSDSCMENIADIEFMRQKLIQFFASERVQETLKYTLKQFEQLGIWD